MKLKVLKFNTLKSTNDKAIELIRKNISSPKLIVSTKQTNGKGTMGKKWISQKGNLFISIFFQTKIKPEKISIFNPYIIRNILNNYCENKIKIKWPNDLLIKGKKLCGILQEVIEFKSKSFLIIGIGINTIDAPVNKKFNAVALSSFPNKKVKNKEILDKIKLSYEKFISDIRSNKISTLKNKYLKIKK